MAMAAQIPERPPSLRLLERLADLVAATTVEDVLHAAVEAACLATASTRGLAGLCGPEGVAADDWYDAEHGWTPARLHWGADEGAPGRVCVSATPLVCNSLPPTAEGLPEATEWVGLSRFACVPLVAGAPDLGVAGFVEVGDAAHVYGPGDVRKLGALARLTATRLGELMARARDEIDRRIQQGPGTTLLSLEPESVLHATEERLLAVLGGGEARAYRVQDARLVAPHPLTAAEEELLGAAVATRRSRRGEASGPDDAALLALPLPSAGGVAGVVLLRTPKGAPDAWTHALLTIVAEQAGAALENAASHQVQVDISRSLQDRLAPISPPRLPGIDLAVEYRAATAGAVRGGDFVDFYHLTRGHLALVVGDVSGHGVDALARAFVAKHVLRALVVGGQVSGPPRPGAALQGLHNALLDELDAEHFVTALFATLSVRNGRLRLASAGHPAPFIAGRSGVVRPLLLTTPPIGAEPTAELAAHPTESIALARGDTVLFFSDGLSEVRDANGAFYEDRLAEVLGRLAGAPAASIVAGVLEDAAAFATEPLADDLVVVCLRFGAQGDA